MSEIELKYGCNPNQKPSRIYMEDGSELPVTVLNGKPGYINFLDAFNGWQLVKELKEHDIPIEANTLYPLMRRLESQGLLMSEWDTGETKPRKYYSITEDGRIVLKKARENWRTFSGKVDSLLEDGGED